MCGISGFYQYNSNDNVDEQIMHNMIKTIHHRGPDDEGLYFDQGLAMGMRWLSIIDLESGKQPIYNEDKSIVIVFNGEIYNYQELAKQLQQRGHKFVTNSDTEVIVHLYEEMGEDCVHELRGMFAFSIWDKRRRQIFIARDRLGIKPLYYTEVEKCLIFGSEIKSILKHPKIQIGLDLEALSHYTMLKYVPAPQTMFKGIKSLPPGHLMICNSNGIKIRQYWDVSFTENGSTRKKEEAYAEELEVLIRESIKLRLRSDVPFGAFLSGGVDSSIIVAIMSRFLNEPVKTFSVGYDRNGSGTDELPYARLVAKKFNTDHHEIFITAKDFIDMAEKVTWHLDQPIADQATAATYMVSKLASQHVKMVLTGEGGDELFAGYARYSGERFSPLFSYMPRSLKTLAWNIFNHFPGLRRPKSALYALCQENESSRFTNWFPPFNQDNKTELFSTELKQELINRTTANVFAQHLKHTDATSPLNRMLYVDTKLWLPDYLLLRGDKLSMAASLEARVPLLDHKLVEFAANLPTDLKLQNLKRKYLLKKVGSKLIPDQIINRKKEGFPIPIEMWLKNEAHQFMNDYLSPATIKKRGLFNYNYIEGLIKEFKSGFADHSMLLWGLISLELWQRCYLDS